MTAQALQWLSNRVDTTDTGLAIVLARLLAWRARFCHFLARYEETDQLIEQSLTLARECGATQVIPVGIYVQGCNAGARGDYVQARQLFQESLALYRDTGDQYGAVELLTCLGGVAYDQGDFVETRRWWEEGYAVCRALATAADLPDC